MGDQFAMNREGIVILFGRDDEDQPFVREHFSNFFDERERFQLSHGIVRATAVALAATLAWNFTTGPLGEGFGVPVLGQTNGCTHCCHRFNQSLVSIFAKLLYVCHN
jgi:hypothetical protein